VTNHLVDGRLLPDHVAGHVALELCNTKALWGLSTEREYLVDFEVLALWAREHRVLTPDETRMLREAGLSDREQAAALRRVRSLRAALFTSVTTESARVRTDALAEVQRFVTRAVGRSSYWPGPGPLELHAPVGPHVVVDRCALAAHRLLAEYGPDAVGLCASAACGWVFLDPAHRRRWCSMAVCGNRAKARRFAARHR
jgi:predicted RNA-binding Zn ribbon-like protein